MIKEQIKFEMPEFTGESVPVSVAASVQQAADEGKF